MITPENYYETVQEVDFSHMPAAIQEGHSFVNDVSDEGNNWESYYESLPIKETVDIYFKSLEKQMSRIKGKTISPKSGRDRKPKEKTEEAKLFIDKKVKMPDQEGMQISAKTVERIEDDIKLIKRYASMHGKEKNSQQILNFINALQRAILEKRIRKTSPYAEQITYIQDNLIKLYNKMGNDTVEIKIRENVLSDMLNIAGSAKIKLSIAYLKRYISMQGKSITKEKAERLLNVIAKSLDKEKIEAGDPYMEKLKKVLSALRSYIKSATENNTLYLQEATLSGIQRALDGCGCSSHIHALSGTSSPDEKSGPIDKNAVMNSMDFSQMKFDTLGFNGKWLELIGDPTSNFSAMIFGKPKMGKSYLAVDFAGYLARNFGRVLYVAREEGLDHTLQEKLNQKNVQHINLFVTSALPEDISRFAFIFLDSVNSLGLAPEDLQLLREKYPSKSFVCIFQSTKGGSFRGPNKFQHDVDVVIEVPEKGKAVQMGRYNQGGIMDIFTNVA